MAVGSRGYSSRSTYSSPDGLGHDLGQVGLAQRLLARAGGARAGGRSCPARRARRRAGRGRPARARAGGCRAVGAPRTPIGSRNGRVFRRFPRRRCRSAGQFGHQRRRHGLQRGVLPRPQAERRGRPGGAACRGRWRWSPRPPGPTRAAGSTGGRRRGRPRAGPGPRRDGSSGGPGVVARHPHRGGVDDQLGVVGDVEGPHRTHGAGQGGHGRARLRAAGGHHHRGGPGPGQGVDDGPGGAARPEHEAAPPCRVEALVGPQRGDQPGSVGALPHQLRAHPDHGVDRPQRLRRRGQAGRRRRPPPPSGASSRSTPRGASARMASRAAAPEPARTGNATKAQSSPSAAKAALCSRGDSEWRTGSPITPAMRVVPPSIA